VQDSYIVGVGDQVQVIMVGHENATYTITVDRDGRIVLLNLPPIAAAGRTFGDVRTELTTRIASTFLNTKSFISIASVRQIGVLVTGEVASPGLRTLTALNTPLDALILSGGIKKTGSLRGVYIVRGGRRIPLDIYSIITRGNSGVGALTEGDRIVVPPLGGTVAITGLVRRPGIYELSPGSSRIAVNSLLALAGGVEIAGAKRLSKLELEADGRTRMVSLPKEGRVANGEVLFVDANRSSTSARVTLGGAVSVPGVHALGSSPTLSGLLRDNDDLAPNAYTLFAIIVRHDPTTNFLKLVPFSIAGVFNGTENLKLIDDDSIYVFSTSEVQALASAAATALYNATSAPGAAALNQQQGVSAQPTATGSTGSNTVSGNSTSVQLGIPPSAAQGSSTSSAAAPSSQQQLQMATAAQSMPQQNAAPSSGQSSSGQSTTTGQQPGTTQTGTSATQTGASVQQVLPGQSVASPTATNPNAPVSLSDLANRLGVSQVSLTNLAMNYLVWVNGEVLNPGPLLAENGTSLSSMLEAAGGLQRQADLSGVTVTSTEINAELGTSRTLRNTYARKDTDFGRVLLRPFDSISVRPVFSDRTGESITINGQVRYPGTYEFTRDERLSSVIARAGGLTDEAYVYGAVFTRQSAAVAEAQANQREAMMLNDQIATAAAQVGANTQSLTYMQTMVTTLQHQPALGRISITIDPAVLMAHPDRDPLLETGDAIYIPKRPATVAVTGEVLNGGAFAWKPGMTIDDYIDLAGGETDAAEDSDTFVIMPDGTAVTGHSSWWSFGNHSRIPPGATVVIPRDPQPFNWLTFASIYTDIISKVAITAASLAVIGK
jgi:polysaccharide biosynthesis/export protein